MTSDVALLYWLVVPARQVVLPVVQLWLCLIVANPFGCRRA